MIPDMTKAKKQRNDITILCNVIYIQTD